MPNKALHAYKMGRANAVHFEGEGGRWPQAMKKTVYIPKGGMPPWRPEAEPDSRLHAMLRTVVYCLICMMYVGLMVLHFLRVIQISMHGMSILAISLVLSIPAIEYLIRPGKGMVWLITIVLMPVFVLMPFLVFLLIVVFPIVLLITQGVKARKNRENRPTKPSTRTVEPLRGSTSGQG